MLCLFRRKKERGEKKRKKKRRRKKRIEEGRKTKKLSWKGEVTVVAEDVVMAAVVEILN